MNLKGFDGWEHSEQSHRDKQMQDIESDWLTNWYIQKYLLSTY